MTERFMVITCPHCESETSWSTRTGDPTPEPSPIEKARLEAASEMANAEFTVADLVSRLHMYLSRECDDPLRLGRRYWAIALARLAIAWSDSCKAGALDRVRGLEEWVGADHDTLDAVFYELHRIQFRISTKESPRDALDRLAAIACALAVQAESEVSA